MKNKETTKNQIKIKRYKKTNVILPLIGGVALVGGAAAGIAIGVSNLPIVAAEESTVYVSPTTNEATLIFDMKEEVKDNTVDMSILSTEPQNSINGDAEVVFVNGGQTTTAAVVGGKVKAKVTLAFYPTVKNTYKYTFNIGMWYTNGQGKHVEREVKNLTLVYTCANFIDNTEAAKTDEEHLPVGIWKQDDVTGNWNAELVYKGFSFVGFERMPNIELTGGFLGLSTNKPFAEIVNFNNSLEAGKPGSFDVRISYSLTNEEFESKSQEELMGVSGDIIFKDYLTDEVIEVKVSQAGGITYFGQFGAAPARFKAYVYDQEESGTVIDTLAKGDVAYARATEFEPSWATPTVTWTSSNDKIATIDKDSGEIYAICDDEFGEVMFTATSTIDQTISALVTINVTDVAPTSVTIGEGWQDLALTSETSIKAIVNTEGESGYNDKVMAVSSNSEIATASILPDRDAKGHQIVQITPKKAGVVTITVKSIVDETIGDTKTLNIIEKPSIQIVSKDNVSALASGWILDLTAVIDNPKFVDLDKNGFSWSVKEGSTGTGTFTVDPSDSTKAQIQVHGVAGNQVIVHAQSNTYSDISDDFTINIKEVESIQVDVPSTEIPIGGTTHITVKVFPTDLMQRCSFNGTLDHFEYERTDNSLFLRGKAIGSDSVEIRCSDKSKTIRLTVTPLPTDAEVTVPRTDVFAGDSIQATAKFTSESGVPCQDVTWSTSDSSLATVAIDGTVSIKSTATTSETKTVDIIATSKFAPSVKASKTLTIHPKATKVEISAPQTTVKATETLQATATVTPSTALNQITWSSNDETKATVDENGLITGVAAGNVNITATNIDGTSATLAITVGAAPVHPTKVTITPAKLTANPGETVATVVTTEPSPVTYPEVTYHSSDNTVASFDANGNLHALKESTNPVQIWATVDGVDSAKVSFTVHTPLATAVEIDQGTTLSISAGDTSTLTAKVTGETGVSQDVTWSSNSTKVMIDKTTGQIAALEPTGETPVTITATSVAPKSGGGHASDTIAVSVIPAPTVTLTYEPEELEIPTSQFVEASPTVSTSGFTSTVTKTYSTQTTLPSGVSLNPTTGVLSVASSTVLTGVLLVDIKVTCTDEDGHTASDNFTVTVKNPESAKDEFYVNNYVLHEETGVAELSSGTITHNVDGTFNAEALVEYQLIDWTKFEAAPASMTIELLGQEASYVGAETHIYIWTESGTSAHWEELIYNTDYTINDSNHIMFTTSRIASIYEDNGGLIKVDCQYTLQEGPIKVVANVYPAA